MFVYILSCILYTIHAGGGGLSPNDPFINVPTCNGPCIPGIPLSGADQSFQFASIVDRVCPTDAGIWEIKYSIDVTVGDSNGMLYLYFNYEVDDFIVSIDNFGTVQSSSDSLFGITNPTLLPTAVNYVNQPIIGDAGTSFELNITVTVDYVADQTTIVLKRGVDEATIVIPGLVADAYEEAFLLLAADSSKAIGVQYTITSIATVFSTCDNFLDELTVSDFSDLKVMDDPVGFDIRFSVSKDGRICGYDDLYDLTLDIELQYLFSASDDPDQSETLVCLEVNTKYFCIKVLAIDDGVTPIAVYPPTTADKMPTRNLYNVKSTNMLDALSQGNGFSAVPGVISKKSFQLRIVVQSATNLNSTGLPDFDAGNTAVYYDGTKIWEFDDSYERGRRIYAYFTPVFENNVIRINSITEGGSLVTCSGFVGSDLWVESPWMMLDGSDESVLDQGCYEGVGYKFVAYKDQQTSSNYFSYLDAKRFCNTNFDGLGIIGTEALAIQTANFLYDWDIRDKVDWINAIKTCVNTWHGIENICLTLSDAPSKDVRTVYNSTYWLHYDVTVDGLFTYDFTDYGASLGWDKVQHEPNDFSGCTTDNFNYTYLYDDDIVAFMSTLIELYSPPFYTATPLPDGYCSQNLTIGEYCFGANGVEYIVVDISETTIPANDFVVNLLGKVNFRSRYLRLVNDNFGSASTFTINYCAKKDARECPLGSVQIGNQNAYQYINDNVFVDPSGQNYTQYCFPYWADEDQSGDHAYCAVCYKEFNCEPTPAPTDSPTPSPISLDECPTGCGDHFWLIFIYYINYIYILY